ncbi:dipeptide ABC transporter ATP-binding protein [Nocardioides marmotae]|uniref:ABC transporter ATP-binding protein n=1 Tax=Nocardioides marmotae TaxID=2663857 RepID=UPI0012B5A02F|nr:ABC transporter ATP-binding protein [Nocardioides marmotae]MBC9734448.1 ABC transporter ATP-binding protein [Nocardioides marmotae]MTB85548.1 dipeptide ABC transporter ATP-binding protein [Nocardioides marmotae]
MSERTPGAGVPVLEVRDLTVEFRRGNTWTRVLDGVDLRVQQDDFVGMVGESGSGKTVTALATMGLLASNARIVSGEVLVEGRDVLKASADELSDLRGNSVAMIFQEAMRSLNPGFTVGDQIAEQVRRHRPGITRADAWARAVEMLELVEIPHPEKRARSYPHQLSGGMCQRVMIAMALSCDPKLLIADEPTTALDVTVQAQILRLLMELRERIGIGVVLITHDLGIVAETCDRVAVMYSGQIVEQGRTTDIFARPRHPYTAGLIGAIPNLSHRSQELVAIPGRVPPPGSWPAGCRFQARCPHAVPEICSAPVPLLEAEPQHHTRCARVADLVLTGVVPAPAAGAGTADAPAHPTELPEPLMVVGDVSKSFAQSRSLLGRVKEGHQAVRDVSLTVGKGETLVVVGESGAGKSTLGRMLLRLEDPDHGTIEFDGEDIAAMPNKQLRRWRSDAQMIFQDPFNSLDPRVSILSSLTEPMRVHGISTAAGRKKRALDLLERVGLPRQYGDRFPYEFSGGQLQRIAIARALTTEPKLIVCDEPVAALDMSIRAQVINLLRDLQAELGISYVFITHDLSLVRVIADRVVVMYRGSVVEVVDGHEVFEEARHPYTRRLLEAVPLPDPQLRRLKDLAPLQINEEFPQLATVGCPYARYCPHAHERCGTTTPVPVTIGRTQVACHLFSGDGEAPGAAVTSLLVR